VIGELFGQPCPVCTTRACTGAAAAVNRGLSAGAGTRRGGSGHAAAGPSRNLRTRRQGSKIRRRWRAAATSTSTTLRHHRQRWTYRPPFRDPSPCHDKRGKTVQTPSFQN
jgi:hypothetical protein